MVLLILIVYIFGILFLQAMHDHMADPYVSMPPEALEKADAYFGSLWLSMLSLFMSIAGGVSWIELLQPLKAVSPLWVAVFLFYISCLLALST